MNKYSYPFVKEKNKKVKPKIPIRVINFHTGQSIHTIALLDTGADSCTFPSMITLSVGYKLTPESLREKGTFGISGEELDTYVHPFIIEILSPDRKKVIRTLNIVGNTIITNTMPPILGTHLFLEKFKITFDYINDFVHLEW